MFKTKKSKWGNRKVVNKGEKYDSNLEFERHLFLKKQESIGKISNLRRQVSFELTRRRYKSETKIGKNGKELKPKLSVYERSSHYVADFVYDTIVSGELKTIVEDTKGHPTVDYILKRKMMLEMHNIAIMEIKTPCEPIPIPPVLAN